MGTKHWLGLAVIIVVAFYIGKKYPTLGGVIG